MNDLVTSHLRAIGQGIPDGHLKEVIQVLAYLLGNDSIILARDFVERMQSANLRYFTLGDEKRRAVSCGLLREKTTKEDADNALKRLVVAIHGDR